MLRLPVEEVKPGAASEAPVCRRFERDDKIVRTILEEGMQAVPIVLAMAAILVPNLGRSDEPRRGYGHVQDRPAHDDSTRKEGTNEVQDEHDEGALHEHHGEEAFTSMADTHAHMGPHFRWTTLRPADPTDQERAAGIVKELQKALAPYRDYRQALKDGYEPFLPEVKQQHYHFTHKWRAFKSAFRFNAGQPTSLLYKKTADGYELEGAMYTAPKRASEKDLHKRMPLSVAQWHAHVDICLPPKREVKTADWKQFGPRGSILTKQDCEAVNGRWFPQLFGWMLHVYPFKDSAEAIWTR
ncbi:MAG TPA: hypothetical protein VLE03_09080 [Nitrospiraceae bacterium]|nr:hypothetical protein [Nitrospiraceae bacterium]